MILANFLSRFRHSDRSVDVRVYAVETLLHLATEGVHRSLDSPDEVICHLELGGDGLEDIIQLEWSSVLLRRL